mmetsp:Transcript_39720/g.131452  ORF Transcript_39720/g.131452 Transcript_39720/m.131452 type:complete len:241 (-) Transcript_39720:2848-3570(-)
MSSASRLQMPWGRAAISASSVSNQSRQASVSSHTLRGKSRSVAMLCARRCTASHAASGSQASASGCGSVAKARGPSTKSSSASRVRPPAALARRRARCAAKARRCCSGRAAAANAYVAHPTHSHKLLPRRWPIVQLAPLAPPSLSPRALCFPASSHSSRAETSSARAPSSAASATVLAPGALSSTDRVLSSPWLFLPTFAPSGTLPLLSLPSLDSEGYDWRCHAATEESTTDRKASSAKR